MNNSAIKLVVSESGEDTYLRLDNSGTSSFEKFLACKEKKRKTAVTSQSLTAKEVVDVESKPILSIQDDKNVLYILGVEDKVRNDFMDTISGFKIHEHVSYPNHLHNPTKYEHAIFLSQADKRDSTSTVKEELLFSAKLAWESKLFTQQEIMDVVDELISIFDLTSVTKKQWRSLNPSQKVRLSIASELLFFPTAIYVRDPIMDMDDADSWEIVKMLNFIANFNICKIVCTLNHAPYEVFKELENVLLLSRDGDCLFSGNSRDMEKVFRARNLNCPNYQNVGDFVLNCTRLLSKDALPSFQFEKSELEQFHRQPYRRVQNPLYQFLMLSRRELNRALRDSRVLKIRFISTICVMGFFALIFMYGADVTSPTYSVGSHFGSALFPLFSTSLASALAAVTVASETRPVLMRERLRGLYSTIPYVVAMVIPELVLNLILSVIIINELSWSVGWKGDMGISIANVFLCIESATSYAWFFAFTFSPSVAFRFTFLFMVPQFLFIGTVVRVTLLPVYLQWVSWICTIAYGVKIAVLNELQARFCTTPSICLQWSGTKVGLIAEEQSIWIYFLVLALVFAVFRFLSILSLEWKIHKAT